MATKIGKMTKKILKVDNNNYYFGQCGYNWLILELYVYIRGYQL